LRCNLSRSRGRRRASGSRRGKAASSARLCVPCSSSPSTARRTMCWWTFGTWWHGVLGAGSAQHRFAIIATSWASSAGVLSAICATPRKDGVGRAPTWSRCMDFDVDSSCGPSFRARCQFPVSRPLCFSPCARRPLHEGLCSCALHLRDRTALVELVPHPAERPSSCSTSPRCLQLALPNLPIGQVAPLRRSVTLETSSPSSGRRQ
jgi:hypothetical protein